MRIIEAQRKRAGQCGISRTFPTWQYDGGWSFGILPFLSYVDPFENTAVTHLMMMCIRKRGLYLERWTPIAKRLKSPQANAYLTSIYARYECLTFRMSFSTHWRSYIVHDLTHRVVYWDPVSRSLTVRFNHTMSARHRISLYRCTNQNGCLSVSFLSELVIAAREAKTRVDVDLFN